MQHSCDHNSEGAALHPGQRLVLAFIRAYQIMLSPWIGRQCRFYPTCSHYASEAVASHGVTRGLWLGLKRLGKCHPFHPGGVDPVPGAHRKTPSSSA